MTRYAARVVVNKKLLTRSLACGVLASGAAMAAGPYQYGYGPDYSGTYIGVSAGEVLYNESGLNQMAPTILLVRLGQQFSPYLAVEGRVGTTRLGTRGMGPRGPRASRSDVWGGPRRVGVNDGLMLTL